VFFLTKLDEHYYDDIRNLSSESRVQPVFIFYLSAFISAARSVTWIMRSEYSRLSWWDDWWAEQRPDESAVQLLRLFNSLRIRSEKVEPVRPGHFIRVEGDGGPLVQRDPRLPRVRMTITPVGEGPQQSILSGEVLAFTWTIDELQGADLVVACREYYRELERLVTACEIKFKDTASSSLEPRADSRAGSC
jgi:hypothetical protein